VTRILLIEDNPGDALIVEEALEEGVHGDVTCVVAETLAEGLDALDAHDIACVLCDLGLPGVQGTDAVGALVDAHPDVPVIVLTGQRGAEVAVEALAAGAQDYIVKAADLDPDALARAIRYAIDRHRIRGELRRANERLSEFAGVVAHDLKAPLAGLVGYLKLASRQAADDTLTMMLDRAGASANELASIIDTLLDFARFSSAGVPERVHMAALTSDLVTAFDPILQQQGGRIVVSDIPDVMADESALRHAMHNLVANALKYAHPERPPMVRIDGALQGDRVRVSVSDNGLGIPLDAREQVFEMGVQLTPGSQGIGLGLPSVRNVVQANGGQVWVEDGPDGVGTTIVLSLPTPADVQIALDQPPTHR
jgi:signal transduction histidine kinase